MSKVLSAPAVLMGIPFHRVSFDEALAWASSKLESDRPGYIATANLDFLFLAWQDPELQRILIDADLVIADGAPIVWISSLFGSRLPARVAGSDLAPTLIGVCRDKKRSAFLLGGASGVADKAAKVLCGRFPGLRIAGTFSPPNSPVIEMNHEEILEQIHTSSPDLLLVAFGAPKQEKWINMHFRTWKVPLAIGIGGTLDFLAGTQIRAPKVFQKIGMEWFWRMMTNPRRLFGRYADDLLFLISSLTRMLSIRLFSSTKTIAPALHEADRTVIKSFGAVIFDRSIFAGKSEEDQSMTRAAESTFIVVDCTGVSWMSSTELGVLLSASTHARRHGHRLWLYGVSPRLEKLLILCRLGEYLPIAEDPGELTAQIRAAVEDHDEGKAVLDAHGCLLITLPHELTAVTAQSFKEKIENTTRQSFVSCVIDASPTRFIDSAGLGFLVALRKSAQTHNASFSVSGFHGPVLKTIHAARMDAILA
jgi:N-acetylglucosaminyldiphosphoundecaprenol N-acetyl-beta-D-mannosaminyltransferase